MNNRKLIFTLTIFILFNIFSRIIHIAMPYHNPTDIIWHNVLAVVWFILLGVLHVMILKSKSELIFFIPFYWLVEILRLFYLTWIQEYFRIEPLCFLYDLGIPLWGGDYLLTLYQYYTKIYFDHVPAYLMLHHIIRLWLSVVCIAFSLWYAFHFKIAPHSLGLLGKKIKHANKKYIFIGIISLIIILRLLYILFLSINLTGRRL